MSRSGNFRCSEK